MSGPPTSPQILTPVADHQQDPPQVHVNSDSEDRTQPVSLLTALIQSSDNKAGKAAPFPSGLISTQSSAPSTAFSSPRQPGHGILQQTKSSEHKASILRRESNSGISDEGHVGLGLGGMEALASQLEKVEEKRERIGWAQDVDQPRGLKFAVASHPKHSPTGNTLDNSNDDDTDDGYQEDEEDGFDSDSSGDSQIDPRFPFARPTNFEQHPRYIGSTHIPPQQSVPAPALLPPPSRRGRGHIRVDGSTTNDKTCSRHRSPPPTRSRSSSRGRSATRSPSKGRLSDAGPREGRAGSPMPEAVFNDSDEEEEEDAEEEEESLQQPSHAGWRSDDAVFYGPKARQVTPIPRSRPRRHSSALDHTVFVDSDGEEEVEAFSKTGGIGDLLRRASEHIPGFRRPSSGMERVSSGGGNESAANKTVAPCPPALDNTPAMAQGRFTDQSASGLTHRLESALSLPSTSNSTPVSRANSVNRHHDADYVARRPATAQSIPTREEGDQMGWTDDQLLKIRRSSRV